MIIYNIKIVLRNTFRNKVFSSINLFGLAIGLAASLFIVLWVWDELSFDRFYDNANNIYMLVNTNTDDQGNSVDYVESPAPMADYLVNNIAGIEKAARVDYFYSGGLIQKGNDFYKEKGASVDDSFFEIFKIPFIFGDKNNVFENLESVVISQSMAIRYYGNKNPVGEILKVKAYGDIFKTATITGVYKDFPGNSTIKLDFIIPFLLEEKSYLENWDVSIYATFVLLDQRSELSEMNSKLATIYKNVIGQDQYSAYLFPFVKLHLHSNLTFFNNENKGNLKLIYILVFIAILILLIASINYMNLANARSIKKMKEFSIKRILGISRAKLFLSILTESVLFTLISFYIAIIFVELTRPVFNNLTGKELNINYFEPKLLLVLIITISLIGLISAYFPYLFILSHKPDSFLKSKLHQNNKGLFAKRFLVVFQFVISIVLIIFSSVIIKQVNYIYSKDLGFNKENVIMINATHLGDKVKIFKQELLKKENVVSVTQGNSPMRGSWPDTWSWEGKNISKKLKIIRINSDSDYLNTLGINLKKGRFFSEERPGKPSIVINQKFAEQIGKEDIIGTIIYFRDEPYEIIGVTENFHSNHFSEDMKMLAFFNEPTWQLLIKIKEDNKKETIPYIESVYKEFVTDRAFEYTSLEQSFDYVYHSEVRAGKLFGCFSILVIFISCLGLFGISFFATELRTKEIGIRKILGASSSNIIAMLNLDFVRWILLSYSIACPIAYYFTKRWLQDYVYRTELSWWLFILAGILVLIMTIITVSLQTYKVASKNPVVSLRYE
jgi:putative ABC transport system permease protein